MPVAKGSALDPVATRARVLDTATRLFAERGVHAVGVNDIAAAAGASKLSLYRHFGSKQQLVAAMLAERSARAQAWLRHGSADAPPGPERVLAVFDALAGWFAEADFHGCAVVNTTIDTRAGDPEILGLARAHLRGYHDLLVERVRELDPAPGEPDSADSTARQLLLLVEGAITVATLDRPRAAVAVADARAAAAVLVTPRGAPAGGTARASPARRGRTARR